MDLGIGKVVNEGNGNAIVYTALLAAMIANCLPTPADAIYFSRVNKLERQFDAGEITAEQVEWSVALEYYVWTAAWYGLLFAGIYSFGGKYKNNARILLAIAAAGLAFGVVNKNIEIDKAIQDRKSKGLSTSTDSTTAQTV
jgi:hypothetical protein